MNKRKVAIIAGQLVVGGAEQQLFLWLSNLDRDKFDVMVLTLHPDHSDYWENLIKDLGYPLIKIPRERNRLKRLHNILNVLEVYKPDLLHGWHLFTSPYASFAAKILKKPVIGSLRDSFHVFCKNPISAFLTLSTVNAVMTNSYSAAKEVKRIKFKPSQKVIAIQNAYLAKTFSPWSREEISQKFGVCKELAWIGTVGRLDPKKRFDLLIQSIAGIYPRKYHLFVIGDGVQRNYLEDLVQELDLSEYVTFTGEMPNAVSLMPILDIFAFSSMDEGMPNVIMEAAATGLPIVTWDLPFYREILINGQTGILVKPGNLDLFRHAIEELLQNPKRRRELGSTARDHILSTFTVERYIQNMTSLYDQLLVENESSEF